jgi:hypothetical protein
MKNKKEIFFPYLPYNRIEDNKRTKHIIDILEKNPFVFHKKKNIFNNTSKNESKDMNGKDKILNDNNPFALEKLNNINNDKGVLDFQRVHEENRNIFNDLIEKKSKTIEVNTQNYLNFIAQKNKSDILKKNSEIKYIKFPISEQNLPLLNNHPNFIIQNELKDKKYRNLKKSSTENNLLLYNSPLNSDINNIINKNYIPGKKGKRSDITNPFFYDGIPERILKLNKEVMDYNIKASENKHNKEKILYKFYDDLPLDPQQINNPKYYNLGESSLEINPIISRGHYPMINSKSYKNFNKHKSEFINL